MSAAAKRARDLQVGDVLPDGSRVVSTTIGTRGYNIRVVQPDGTKRRLRYAPETIVNGPDDPHPSRFANGHPWDRYQGQWSLK